MLKFTQKETHNPTVSATTPSTNTEQSIKEQPFTSDTAFVEPGSGTVALRPTAFPWTTALIRGTARTAYRLRKTRLPGRKLALVTLIASALVGGRWLIANTPPQIPLPKANQEPTAMPVAWHFYTAAMDALNQGQYEGYDPQKLPLAEQRRAVEAAANSLRLTRQGFAQPFSYPRPDQLTSSYWFTSSVEGQKSPSIAHSQFWQRRAIPQLFISEAKVAGSEGRHTAALSAALDAVRFGKDIGHGVGYLNGADGVMIQHMGTGEALHHVDGLTASEARRSMARVQELLKEELTFPEMLEQQRILLYNIMDQVYHAPSSQASRILSSWGATRSIKPFDWDDTRFTAAYDAAILWYGKDGIFEANRRLINRAQEHTRLPFQEFKVRPVVTPEISFLDSLLPDYYIAFKDWTDMVTQKHILLTRLALQAYKQEHGGKLPASLEELTTGTAPYLSSVPADLFSADGKMPLRYQKGVPYSVGENGKDDGNTGDDALVTPW